MNQLIFLFSGLIFIAGVIILTGHLNRRKHKRAGLATLANATTEQVEQFVRENLGKWASVKDGSSGCVCGYKTSRPSVILGMKKDNGWSCGLSDDIILKNYKLYLFSGANGNLSLIKITKKL